MIKGLKWLGALSLIAIPISIIIGFLELVSIGNALILALIAVLFSIQFYALLWSKQGFLRLLLYVMTILQMGLSFAVLFHIVELKLCWNIQFSLAIGSFSMATISTTLGNKFSPFYYMFMYVLLAIVLFSLIALPISTFSTSVLLISIVLLVLTSLWLYRLELKKNKA